MATPLPRRPPAAVSGLFAVLLAACEPIPGFPEPDAWGPLSGPGGPSTRFEPEDLFAVCAWLDGGPTDQDHHNGVFQLDGWLVLPWAPEWSGGGMTAFDISDPCAPIAAGSQVADGLREPHNIGLARVGDRVYAAADWHGGLVDEELQGGVMFWDLTDPTRPEVVSTLHLPGYIYPDSYARLSASVLWQGNRVWVSGADNGFWVVDATDPSSPALESQYVPDPPFRVGAVHVVGDVAMVSAFEGATTVLLDVSDPAAPQPFPGGRFEPLDASGQPREYYFANVGGRWALFARKDAGAGYTAVDLSDPRAPTQVSVLHNPQGGGGYVLRHESLIFEGEGDGGGGGIYDVSDPAAPTELGRIWMTGDLDFLTPVGNVAVASVDEDAVDDRASGVAPWSTEPDARGPSLDWFRPTDGATGVPLSARVGLSFDENVDFASVFEGSFRVADGDGRPVRGRYSGQDTLAHFEPEGGWLADTTYTVEVPAGGIVDASGNPTVRGWTFRFSTGASVDTP